jgi:hypothetical protein
MKSWFVLRIEHNPPPGLRSPLTSQFLPCLEAPQDLQPNINLQLCTS